MVVYCRQYISQSMRHHVARARAVLLAVGRLRRLRDQKHLTSSKQGKDNMSKLRRVQAMGQVLRGPTLQLPLLVNDLLHKNAGYQIGSLVLQCTCAVFFRLHLCAAQMWWQFACVGCPQWEWKQLF